MATQWTAGIVDNTALPAATLNTIGAVWQTWTPTYSASAGTFTTITTVTARYSLVQKICTLHIQATVTTLGTASGFMTFTLPFTAFVSRNMGIAREVAVVGHAGVIDCTGTTTGSFILYAAGNTAVANYSMSGTLTYEIA